MLRLLYVDDDADIREVAEISLQMDSGMEVRTAASGAEALAILSEGTWRPAALLIDVMMPGLDGPATLARARQLDGHAATPAIFMTARAMPDEVAGLEALGALGVITKPFDPLSLAGEVRRLLERS